MTALCCGMEVGRAPGGLSWRAQYSNKALRRPESSSYKLSHDWSTGTRQTLHSPTRTTTLKDSQSLCLRCVNRYLSPLPKNSFSITICWHALASSRSLSRFWLGMSWPLIWTSTARVSHLIALNTMQDAERHHRLDRIRSENYRKRHCFFL